MSKSVLARTERRERGTKSGTTGAIDRLSRIRYLLPYLILELKRAYTESTGVILSKAAALLLLTVALNSLANFAAIRLALV